MPKHKLDDATLDAKFIAPGLITPLKSSSSSSSSSSSGTGLGALALIGLLISGYALFLGGVEDSAQPSTPTRETQTTQPSATAPITKEPVQRYTQSEANACKVWADANPSLAAKLTSRAAVSVSSNPAITQCHNRIKRMVSLRKC